MVVAVTGGRGFIGSILVARLQSEGHDVRILSREPSHLENHFLGDLSDKNIQLNEFLSNVDILYHCAGEINDTQKMHELHVEGTKRLVRAAKGKIRHWVQLSSVGAYGKIRSGKITEETPTAPVGHYEITKTLSDEIAFQAAQAGAFHLTILRPSIVYGPSMINRSFFGLISAIAKGIFFYIGKPGAIANYIHVNNVVEALILCGKASSEKPRVFNLSDDCRFEDLIGEISKCLGKKPPDLRLPERVVRICSSLGSFMGINILTAQRIDALTRRVTYDSGAIRKQLSYNEVITMGEGIREMVQQWEKSVENPG